MNIPPKSIKTQLARKGSRPKRVHALDRSDSADSDGDTARRTQVQSAARVPRDLAEAESVSTESLPVLQAFQEFLENERKHARRQVAAITAFFLILFLLVAGAGAFFGYVYIGKMNTEITSLHAQLAADTNNKKQTADILTALARRTDDLTSRIDDGDDLIKKATSQINDTVSSSLADKMAEIEEIRKALKTLELENRNLRHDLARIQAEPTVATSGIDTTMAATAVSSPMHPPSGIDAAVIRTPKPRVSEALEPLEMAILAPGLSTTLKWRIPISE